MLQRGHVPFGEAVAGNRNPVYLAPHLINAHLSDLPLLVIAPGLALTSTIVSLHMVRDGLRDLLDPR